MKNLDKDSRKTIAKMIIRDVDPNLQPIFRNQKWCVTGSFKNYKPRDKALEIIEDLGGLTGKSVDKTTTHLLAGEKAGDKIEKARKLGVTIVTEDAFVEMLKPENMPKKAAKKVIELTDTSKRDAVISAIREKQWDCGVEYIESLLRPAISIDHIKKQKAEVGQSKIGGKPDLPKIYNWPVFEDDDEERKTPLTFIAQFNIGEFKHLDYLNLLPDSGILYLFMYFLTDGAQDEYSDGGNEEWIRLLHYDGDLSDLKPTSIPKRLKEEDDEYCVGVLKESVLTFKEDYTLPGKYDFSAIEQLSDNDKDNLDDLIGEKIPKITGGRTESQFFGFPQSVQSFSFEDNPEETELPVFFQLSEGLGDFGRCIVDGAFYFFIEKEDLLNGKFDDISAECQYT